MNEIGTLIVEQEKIMSASKIELNKLWAIKI